MAEIEERKLDGAGLSTVWGLVKSLVSNAISALQNVYAPIIHTHSKSDITDLDDATDTTGGLMTDAQAQKLAGIESGAQVNSISGIQKNGVDIQPDVTTKKVNIGIPTKTSDLQNDDNTVKDANYVHTDNNYTSNEKTKLGNIEAGAQVNIIEEVKVNGTALQPTDKSVNVTVPTNVSSLTNDANYQNATQVNALIDSKMQASIKPKGSMLFANLPTPSLSNLGWMWNMDDDFTIDNRFKEYDPQQTKSFSAGTNVYVVEDEREVSGVMTTVYLFDVYQGYIDLSNYATLDDVEALTTSDIQSICV